MCVHWDNFRPCALRVIPGGMLRERPEAARSMASQAASAELVYGPSSLVGWADLPPAVAVPSNQVATFVVK
jgi:hypothetical protein